MKPRSFQLPGVLVAFVLLALAANAQLVSFDPPLSKDWSKVSEGPSPGPLGSAGQFEAFLNRTQKLALVVLVADVSSKGATNPAPDLKMMADAWKDGALAALRVAGLEPTNITFGIVGTNGSAEAELSFAVRHHDTDYYRYNRCRIAGGKFIGLSTVGEGVPVKDNPEIKRVLGNVVVK